MSEGSYDENDYMHEDEDEDEDMEMGYDSDEDGKRMPLGCGKAQALSSLIHQPAGTKKVTSKLSQTRTRQSLTM
jgi:hypothetical protein